LLFKYLDKNKDSIFKLDPNALLHIIEKSCTIKKNIVELDEREKGLRRILNFGHTFGHAIETVTNYQKYSHGEAIAIGMVKALDLSVDQGLCTKAEGEKILALLEKLELPTEIPQMDKNLLLDALQIDKKKQGKTINFVFINKIGQVQVREILPGEILK
jgi:3-dehydroquinate synthase